MSNTGVALLLALACLGLLNVRMCAYGATILDELVTYEIRPSEANSTITRFDDPNYVLLNVLSSGQEDLVVFLPGTNGKADNSAQLLRVVALQGYRVIGLSYNDAPAIAQVCTNDPLPACSAAVRERRLYGNDVTNMVENSRDESIVNRLVDLIRHLAEQNPQQHWLDYLADDEPNWRRIVLSGFSQGAGMAAYVAKQKLVARVVLFSSPWDSYGRSHIPAPWLSQPSATPPQRWFAEYHRRENTAALIDEAYRHLKIPPDHIHVFDLDIPPGFRSRTTNPFHISTTRLPAYAEEWRFLYGRPSQQ